jgi:nicotinamidase-related amidase
VGEWRAYPGALGGTCLHLCVGMQRLFREETDWHTPWLARVLPRVERLVAAHPARTILTRFIPAQHPGEGRGTWSGYSRRWASMTLDRLEPGLVDPVPELARFVPPAETFDKAVYSPWLGTDLNERLRARGIDTLVVTGGGRPKSACWRLCSAPSISATGSFSSPTPCAVPATRPTTRC